MLMFCLFLTILFLRCKMFIHRQQRRKQIRFKIIISFLPCTVLTTVAQLVECIVFVVRWRKERHRHDWQLMVIALKSFWLSEFGDKQWNNLAQRYLLSRLVNNLSSVKFMKVTPAETESRQVRRLIVGGYKHVLIRWSFPPEKLSM